MKNLTWQNPEQLFVAQELINKVKSKCCGIKANEYENPQLIGIFKQARFGMFIHWGLYSVLEGSYKDRTMPDKSLPNGNSWYAEWIQARLDIPAEEYKLMVNQFDPVLFDAEKWVLEAKNAGMNYMVITAKHHDGFALWDSKVSDYDIMQTPYKTLIPQHFDLTLFISS